MTLRADDLVELSELAEHAARAAGEYIAATRPTVIEHKSTDLSPAAQVVTEVDRRAEELIVELLSPTVERRGFALLTEERDDDGGRLRKPYFWCVDPLDGTLPYVEGGDGYAVSIALVSRSGEPVVGVVYRPADGVLYRAVRDGGATRDGAPLHVAASDGARRLSVFADQSFDAHPRRERLRSSLADVAAARALDGVDVHSGAGAVVNATEVLDNGPACYFKLPKSTRGGGSLWDFAATACVAREAGAVATDVYGAALDLNRADSTFMNHRGVLYASDEDLARDLRRACADVLAN